MERKRDDYCTAYELERKFARERLRTFLFIYAFVIAGIILAVCFLALSSSQASETKKTSCSRPGSCISVDFDRARLSEVAFLVSEFTGEGFVFNESEDSPSVSWSQQNIPKEQVLPVFIKVLTSLGLTVHHIEGSSFWAIRGEPALVSGAEKFSSGIYHLRYLDAQAVQKSAEALYGKRLSAFGPKGGKVIAFSGDPDLVSDFSRMLADIDQPPQTDSGIASIRLKHISVRTAAAALADLNIFGKSNASKQSGGSSGQDGVQKTSGSSRASGIFPDYWNRSVVVRGTKEQQDMALVALSAIDKPQEGLVDEVVFLQTVEVDQALAVLRDMYEKLTIRKVAGDRLLISGEDKLVERALASVHRMDGTGLQVRVEAVIAYLTDREFRELGTKFGLNRSHLRASLNSSFADVFPDSYSGLLVDFFDRYLSAHVAANDGFAKGEILSSPVLTVLNGQEAEIIVGQNVPFLSKKSTSSSKDDDSEDGTSVERKDVGLSFTVKPVIRPDGDFIILKVSQELSSVNPESQLSNAVDLIVDKKSVASTVLVGNGDTIMLGGLRVDEVGKSVDMVPFLGEIPLLGQLFTYTAEKVETRHLVVSLRVNVVSSPQKSIITFSPVKG